MIINIIDLDEGTKCTVANYVDCRRIYGSISCAEAIYNRDKDRIIVSHSTKNKKYILIEL